MEAARFAKIDSTRPIEYAIENRGLPAFQVADRTMPGGKRWMLYRGDLAGWLQKNTFRSDAGKTHQTGKPRRRKTGAGAIEHQLLAAIVAGQEVRPVDLIKNTGISRTSTYYHLQVMRGKNLVDFTGIRSTTKYHATDHGKAVLEEWDADNGKAASNGKVNDQLRDELKGSVAAPKVATPRARGKSQEPVTMVALTKQLAKVEFEMGELRFLLGEYEKDRDAAIKQAVTEALERVMTSSGSSRR